MKQAMEKWDEDIEDVSPTFNNNSNINHIHYQQNTLSSTNRRTSGAEPNIKSRTMEAHSSNNHTTRPEVVRSARRKQV